MTLISTKTAYDVTVNTAAGGTVTASPTSATAGESVALTATPASGYVLSGISVTDADSHPVDVDWSIWSNTAN